jgi:hypothetical protein
MLARDLTAYLDRCWMLLVSRVGYGVYRIESFSQMSNTRSHMQHPCCCQLTLLQKRIMEHINRPVGDRDVSRSEAEGNERYVGMLISLHTQGQRKQSKLQ